MLNNNIKRLIKRFTADIAGYVNSSKKLSVILYYHSIHPTHGFATKPDDFMKQMEYLASNFTLMSLSDFYEIRALSKVLPDKMAIVTIDDGYADNYEYAFPILKKTGITATIFLTTGFINGEVPIKGIRGTYMELKALSWEQILEMRESGITFGAHTHTHPILTKISIEDAEREIMQSKNILENKLGEPIKIFSYPFGWPKTFNESIIKVLKKNGFQLACTTKWGSDNSNTDIFTLNRIRVDADDTLDEFKEKIHGDWDFVEKMIQTFKKYNINGYGK